MKNKLMLRPTIQFCLTVFVLAVLLSSCSDDPESTNEEEVITTVSILLTPEEGTSVTLSWDDTNLDAIVDDSEITVSGSLSMNTAYEAEVQLLNKSADPDIDVTEEVEKEAEDHILCFTVTGVNVVVTNRNEDKNGLPVGITSTWTTTTASSGTVNIALRHQPGVKTGDCPGAGDTDASITFHVEVQNPI